ncbi:hypothetical protein MMR14E_28830 [Methylobacterium mesophilicum]
MEARHGDAARVGTEMSMNGDLKFGLELLGKTVARAATGIAATNDGGRAVRKRIVRALEALEAQGLASIVRTADGIVAGAELTAAGLARGQAIAARSAPPERLPGDVMDVAIIRGRDDPGA